MIPVKTAMHNGIWLTCSIEDRNGNRVFDIRLRVLSFEKVNFVEVDDPEKVEFRDEGIYWIMKVEVMNLLKTSVGAHLLKKLTLVDKEGFSFEMIQDYHLCCLSQYSKQSGLHRFFGQDLHPKMKVNGAISFLLPDDDFAEYMIAVKGGVVREA